MANWRILIALLMFVAGPVGCAKYQYSIIEPSELAQTIARKGEVAVEYDSLHYEFVDLGRQLGVRIINPEPEPITILGERSYVVDPDGRSHAMRGGTIAPDSYVAFTIPAMALMHHDGPHIGIGVGVGVTRYSSGTAWGTGFGGSWHDHYPYGYTQTYRSFSWTTGDVQMRLVYEFQDELLEHHFRLGRERTDDATQR